MRKIAFFDIDNTLTSETDGSVPKSAVLAIRKARGNGHLMFLNTGRCYQNIEQRFRDVGFDGYVCGCGTNVYCDGKSIFYLEQTHEVTMQILNIGKAADVDLLFESKNYVCFDLTRPLHHLQAIRQYHEFVARGYDMPMDFERSDFTCDKFVIWFHEQNQLKQFRRVSDKWFQCIDRNGTFREFIPYGCSKATGLQMVLDYYGIAKENAYAFGDSNNDLPMLSYLTNSIGMGNAAPPSLLQKVSYVTERASRDGIYLALKHFDFI